MKAMGQDHLVQFHLARVQTHWLSISTLQEKTKTLPPLYSQQHLKWALLCCGKFSSEKDNVIPLQGSFSENLEILPKIVHVPKYILACQRIYCGVPLPKYMLQYIFFRHVKRILWCAKIYLDRPPRACQNT